MPCKASLGLATLVLVTAVTALAPFAAMGGRRSHASASQATSSQNPAAKIATIEIREFKFEPASLTVHSGDIVEWKNDDVVPHTATADDHDQEPVFDSGKIQTGAAWRHVAPEKGTYNYICTLHPNMHGKLIVE